MDPRTPDRMALSEASQVLFSTPLSSPPSNIAPPSSPFNTVTNAHNTNNNAQSTFQPIDVDSDITSADASSADDEDSERDEDNETDGLSRQEKLQAIAKLLKQYRWSFTDFLTAWVQEVDNYGQQIRLDHRGFGTPKKRQEALARAIASPVVQQVSGGPRITDTLLAEIGSLIKTPYFGRFESTVDLNTIDFTAAFGSVQRHAPTWNDILMPLLQNQRAHWSSYSATPQSTVLQKRLYMVTSLVCHSHAKKQSNFLPSVLDMYLLGSGVKRRVIESLSGLGICHSYVDANRRIKAVANSAKAELKHLATNPQTIVVYDNINFKDTKRDEILGHRTSMQAMTTAAIIICPEIPADGLHQSMHNPHVKLNVQDIFNAPAISGLDSGIGVDITCSLIANAIKRVHPSGVQSIFQDSNLFPKMPVIDRIPTTRTQFWQLGAIPENEGTIQGTYSVHQNIFLDQFGLSAPNDPSSPDHDDFKERLWLVHGDQLTAHHIRAVKAEQSQAKRPYDRRDWLLGIPSWFHIQMNLLNTIVRTHWSPISSSQNAPHCLLSDIITWGRTQGTRDNVKYHIMEPLITQSFTARVVALFYAAMKRKGYLSSPEPLYFERPENIDTEISHLSDVDFIDLIDDIQVSAFTLDAWNGTRHNDTEFKTMCRLLQEIELFLTIRHAVKHGDIGMLRRVVDPLIVYFLGASQFNYAHEMLFYRWNLSPVNTPQLQHAILASGLVNWPGRDTTHKPVDLGLEHLNGSCKIEMKCYKNSTHDANITFDRVCLTNTWIRELREKIEGTFGEDMPTAHSTASAVLDIFIVARNVFTSDLAGPRDPTLLPNLSKVFESEDILSNGMDKIAEKVDWFNQLFVRQARSYQSLYPIYPGDNLETADPLAIHEYAENISEEMDAVVDPTELVFRSVRDDPGFTSI